MSLMPHEKKGLFPIRNPAVSTSKEFVPFIIPPLQSPSRTLSAEYRRECTEENYKGSRKRNESESSVTESLHDSPFGKFQLSLYEHSESNEDFLPLSRLGRIWFTLLYDAVAETLTVKVIKVLQLPGRVSNAPHDSFVKLFLLPDERMSHQTKVKRRTNNPKFNESFVFQISSSDIIERTLRLSVYDIDKRKMSKRSLGHALVSLAEADSLTEKDKVKWKELDESCRPGESASSLGDINMSLCYHPSMNRLTVNILQIRKLKDIDFMETGLAVNVSISRGHRVIKTRETSVKRGECDPHYNESFTFTLTSSDIESSCISVNVSTIERRKGFRGFTSSMRNLLTNGKLQKFRKYGRVVVGSFMFCRGERLLHWQEMLTNPKKAIAKWHPMSEVAPHV